MSPRSISSQDLAYEQLAKTWQTLISNYDTQRRIETLIYDGLSPEFVRRSRVLEAGCGLGSFTEVLAKMGPRELVATDIAPTLVSDLAKRLPSVTCQVADLLDLSAALGDRQFDLVFCSEVIEHTPDPEKAVGQLGQRVAPGGKLVVSCPNRRWIWLLHLAQRLGLRKHYQGYENWVYPSDLQAWVRQAGLHIEKAEGVHTVPWQFLPERVLRRLDRMCRRWNYGLALNLAITAQRPAV